MSSRSGDPSDTIQPSRRKDTHTSRACGMCRRKKSKCDGKKPVCGRCLASGHDCLWSSQDNRRPATRRYLESLRIRIKVLEAANAALQAANAELMKRNTSLEGRSHKRRRSSQSLTVSSNSHPPLTPISIPHSPGFPQLYSPFSPAISLGDDSSEDEDEVEVKVIANVNRLCEAADKLVLEDTSGRLGPFEHFGATSPFAKAPSPTSELPEFPLADDGSRHILCLQPGTDTLNSTPAINWACHLPPEVHLTRVEHDTLLDLFFKFLSSWCFRVCPNLFLRDMNISLRYSFFIASNPGNQASLPPKTPHYSAQLHNAILACATAFSDDPRIRTRTTRDIFARRAKAYIEKECNRPTLSTVQALGLLGTYHSGGSEQSLGFLYFGMSVRMAQALGLHHGCSNSIVSGHLSPDTIEERIWCFWMTFCQDKCWSLYVGRDVGVPLPQTEIPMPGKDELLDKSHWTWHRSSQAPILSWLSTTFLETCKLFKIATRTMEIVYISQRIDYALVNDLHTKLDKWFEKMPDELRITRTDKAVVPPHVIMLNLAFEHLTILLHRPFYRSTQYPTAEHSRKKCDHAAISIVQYLAMYRRLYSLRYVPITPTQIAFTAGTTFLLSTSCLSPQATVARKRALDGVLSCIEFLKEMGLTWEAAATTATMLENLFEEQGESSTTFAPKSASTPVCVLIPPTAVPSPAQSQVDLEEEPLFLQGQFQQDEGMGVLLPTGHPREPGTSRSAPWTPLLSPTAPSVDPVLLNFWPQIQVSPQQPQHNDTLQLPSPLDAPPIDYQDPTGTAVPGHSLEALGFSASWAPML